MPKKSAELTAWGKWLSKQPWGTRNRASRETELALTTIDHAKTNLVTAEVAELLSDFTGGVVRVADIRRPRRRLLRRQRAV